MAATSEITLNMPGGRLNGHAASASIITYQGEVSESVMTSGTVKIRKVAPVRAKLRE